MGVSTIQRTTLRIFNVRMWSSGMPVTADTAEDLIWVSIGGKGYSRGRAGPCIVSASSLKHWLTMDQFLRRVQAIAYSPECSSNKYISHTIMKSTASRG